MTQLFVGLIIAAFAVAQILIGGTRLLYSIPACSLLALAAIGSAWPKCKTSPAVRNGCVATTMLFAVYLLARNHVSPVNYLARPDFFIVLGSAVVYLITSHFAARSRPRMQIFFAIVVLALAHAAVGAAQFKRGDQFMLLPWIHRMDTFWRASGFYISPNHYAGMLEVTILLSMSVAFWSSLKFSYRMLIGYAGLCCLAGFVISGSRGGYLSLAFGTVVLGALSVITLRKVAPHRFLVGSAAIVGGLVAIGLIASFVVLQSNLLKTRVQEIHDPENMRWLLWSAAQEQFRLSPIWGTGSGTYLYYGRMFRNPAVQNDPIYVHNDYLHLLAEYGAVGAALFLLFLGTHLDAGFGNLRLLAQRQFDEPDASRNQLALQLGAISAVATYMVHSVVDFNMHIPANAFLMAWVFGMIANPAVSAARPSSVSRVMRVIARGALAGAGVAILVCGLPKLPGEWFAEQARVALREHRLSEAREKAARALTYEKQNPEIYYYAGESARAMFLNDETQKSLGLEAVEMFTAGLKVFPNDVRTVYKLAEAYDELHEFDRAEAQLERASELDPNASLLSAYYGMHYHAQGFLEEAEQQYQRALELDPKNSIALAGFEIVEKLLKPVRDAMPAIVPEAEGAATEMVPEPESAPPSEEEPAPPPNQTTE